jgi:hypothetical protein
LSTKVPAGHIDQEVQATAFVAVLNDPLEQAEQTRSEVAVGSERTNVPGRQEVVATHGVAEFRSLSHVPDAQETGAASPPAQYWPAAQGAQTAAEVAVPEATSCVPAAQVPWGWQEIWLLLDEYCPAGQAAHERSSMFEGAFVT